MHEISLAGGILRLIEQTRERDPFECVTHITLEVGALSGVEVGALRFALEAIAPDTCLVGAEIDIQEPPAQAWCLPCGQSVPILQRQDLCPQCGSAQLQPTSGTELRLIDLRVR
jgi:hydrogenase nickel incorporation protein HypA/HybF